MAKLSLSTTAAARQACAHPYFIFSRGLYQPQRRTKFRRSRSSPDRDLRRWPYPLGASRRSGAHLAEQRGGRGGPFLFGKPHNGRISNDRRSGRNILYHHCSSAYAHTIPDPNPADNNGVGTDVDIIAKNRRAKRIVNTAVADGYALADDAAIPN